MRVVSEGLELVVLDRAFLASWLDGRPLDRGFVDPAGFLDGADDLVRLRIEDLDSAPQIEPWLLRAIVLREGRTAVGFIGFHGSPVNDVVEIGYEVLPAYRRCGYASEAVRALVRWAAQQGVRVVRASVSPENAPSLAMIAKLGFVQVGERIDEVDGLELVFEANASTLEIGGQPTPA